MTTMLERLGGHAVRGNKKNNKGDLFEHQTAKWWLWLSVDSVSPATASSRLSAALGSSGGQLFPSIFNRSGPTYGQLDRLVKFIHVLNTICKQLHNRAICLVVCDHIHGDERGQLITRPFMCIDYGLMKKIMFSNQELIMC